MVDFGPIYIFREGFSHLFPVNSLRHSHLHFTLFLLGRFLLLVFSHKFFFRLSGGFSVYLFRHNRNSRFPFIFFIFIFFLSFHSHSIYSFIRIAKHNTVFYGTDPSRESIDRGCGFGREKYLWESGNYESVSSSSRRRYIVAIAYVIRGAEATSFQISDSKEFFTAFQNVYGSFFGRVNDRILGSV